MAPTVQHPPRTESQTLAEQYYYYLGLPNAELSRHCANLIRSEHCLDEADFHHAVFLRLQAWLDLDPEDARVFVWAYSRALDAFPPEYRLRSEEAERAAVLNGMSFGDFRKLAQLLPWLKGELWKPGPTAAELPAAA